MLRSLIVYATDGSVVGTLDHMVAKDENGEVVGLIDFEAQELSGDKLRDIIDVQKLDVPVPLGIARQILGRDPRDGEAIPLPPNHPFRVAHETVAGAVTWPEWLGGSAYDFTVELDANKRAVALIHKTSGHRRERDAIESEVASRIEQANGEPADLRDLLGGPDRPLKLDAEGRTQPRAARSQRPNLPVVRRATASPSEDDERTLSEGRGIPKNAQDV